MVTTAHGEMEKTEDDFIGNWDDLWKWAIESVWINQRSQPFVLTYCGRVHKVTLVSYLILMNLKISNNVHFQTHWSIRDCCNTCKGQKLRIRKRYTHTHTYTRLIIFAMFERHMKMFRCSPTVNKPSGVAFGLATLCQIDKQKMYSLLPEAIDLFLGHLGKSVYLILK